MWSFLLITPISRARQTVACAAGNRRRSSPLALPPCAREKEEEPDRRAPPVGESSPGPMAPFSQSAFSSNGKRIPVNTQLFPENVNPRVRLPFPEAHFGPNCFLFLFYFKTDFDQTLTGHIF
jgi:hypothetical protein